MQTEQYPGAAGAVTPAVSATVTGLPAAREAAGGCGRFSRGGLALQNAASVAGLALATEVMVAAAPKEAHDHPPMGGGGMGRMDM